MQVRTADHMLANSGALTLLWSAYHMLANSGALTLLWSAYHIIIISRSVCMCALLVYAFFVLSFLSVACFVVFACGWQLQLLTTDNLFIPRACLNISMH